MLWESRCGGEQTMTEQELECWRSHDGLVESAIGSWPVSPFTGTARVAPCDITFAPTSEVPIATSWPCSTTSAPSSGRAMTDASVFSTRCWNRSSFSGRRWQPMRYRPTRASPRRTAGTGVRQR